MCRNLHIDFGQLNADKHVMRNPRNPSREIPLPGLEQYFPDFMISRKAELETLKLALEKKDLASILKIAHAWKGVAAPYGCGELGYLSMELEEFAEEGKIDECRAISIDIDQYLSSKKL